MVAEASALIISKDYHAQNGINARGARRKPLETFEFPVVSLPGRPGEDMRRRVWMPAAVWADPSLSHIWAREWVDRTASVRLHRPAGVRFPHFPVCADAFGRALVEWVGPVEMPSMH
jgi:hypothetical protein